MRGGRDRPVSFLGMVAMLIQFLSLWLLSAPISMLCIYAALGLQGYFLPQRLLLGYGILLGAMLQIVRGLAPYLGLHIVLFLICLILLIRYVSGQSWGRCIVCSLIAHLTAGLGEGLIAAPTFMLLHVTVEDAKSNLWLMVLGGWWGMSCWLLWFCSSTLEVASNGLHYYERPTAG